jgi:putative flippase GtrA
VPHRLTRFVLVGAAAAAVNVLSRVVISQFVRFEYAVALAFPIALTFAFVMSRLFVFESSQRNVPAQYARFLVVNLFALVQIWLVSIGLSRFLFPAIGWTWYPELLAHVIAVASPVFTSYYAHKMFTFR